MNTRLQHISITNFKAFRSFTLPVEGRHLLIYGENGSGKSSLYWALYTFLQSARKPLGGIAKYFDPGQQDNLLNVFEQREPNPRSGEIALTFREMATKADAIDRISLADHSTCNKQSILRADLASDFITYRFFFGFSSSSYSQPFNLWPLFAREILPFCKDTGGRDPLAMWQQIASGNPNPGDSRGRGGTRAYEEFRTKTNDFATVLTAIVDTISQEAQRFYDRHFAADDPNPVTLKLAVTKAPTFTGTNQQTRQFSEPEIGFGIQTGGANFEKPQLYLNEAKLTQFALSVRFAASLVNLHDSDIKLLVIDDLLVSLDMSNRMKVVEILLGPTFEEYQKIILTHDYGFFREFRRKIASHQSDWCFVRLDGSSSGQIHPKNDKNEIQKAEDHIRGFNLDEAALCLRKACEDTAQRFLNRDNAVDPTKEFTGLREDLRAARNRILGELPAELYEKVIRVTPAAHRNLLIAGSDADIDADPGMSLATKGIMKTQRSRLRRLLTVEHVELLRQVKLIDDIIACTDRVLNPAAHGGNPPLYEQEVQNALALVQQLETALVP